MDPLATLTDALKDRYDVERELGAGGMATVYLARDIKHNRRVALKVLRPDLGAVLGVERFLSEIQVTANLQHPNLLPLFDSGEANGLLFYVMPFVEGETLRARLDREKQLPINDALHIATAVASALEYAHGHGVIHRDLKPENILMQAGEPLIADFGIALAVSNAGGGRITQTGISLGTPQYMSPEQATGDRGIDGRTDIYSLGAVTYEMLAGEPPHLGTNAQAIIARVLTEKPTGLRVTRPNVAEHVEAAVLRALEKLPADRWATAREFADALGNRGGVLTGAGAPSGSSAAARSSRALTWRESFQLPHMRVVLASLAVVVVAAGTRELTRPAREGARPPVRFALTFDDSLQVALATPGSPMALSPDGTVLAFVGGNGRGAVRLYVRQLGDPRPREIAGTEGAVQPFFSPDGQWIGFAVGRQLQKVPVGGGTPQMLAEVPSLQGASWVWRDRIVVAAGGRLAAVPATGGAMEVFAVPDTAAGETALRSPLALPDGNTVLYGSWPAAGVAQMRIGVASLGGGKRQMLDLAGTHPLAVLDGALVYASAAGAIMAVPFDAGGARPTGTPVPVIDGVSIGIGGPLKGSVAAGGSAVYATGGVGASTHLMIASPPSAPRVLAPEARVYAFPRYSPNGRHLAFAVQSSDRIDVWILDLPSGPLRRLTAEGTNNDRPEWTPDSRNVLFRSGRGGRRAIWMQPADGNRGAEPFFEFPNAGVDEAVLSSDGAHLFAQLDTTRAAEGGQVFYRRVRGDTAVKLIAGADRGQQVHPRPSPDGRWIAYSSNELGTWEVYVKPFPALDARYQVSLQGGAQPVWSRDGRRLYYVNGGRLLSAALTLSPAFAVASRDTVLENVEDNTLGSGVGTGFYHANYDVAPDGRSIVFVRTVGSDARIMMVHDWKYELGARMRAGR